MTDEADAVAQPDPNPPTVADIHAETDAATLDLAKAGADAGAALVADEPSAPALPFAVDQHHPIDSLPVGSLSTKAQNATMVTDAPGAQTAQVPIGADDPLHHLPAGTSVNVISDGKGGKQIALTLPPNEFRGLITVIETHVHAAVAKVWHFVQHVEAKVEDAL